DIITLGSALTVSMQVALGGGANKLTLADVANTGTVKNVASLVGGSGADAITLGAGTTNASIDLGAGTDTVVFGSFTNSATVANAETIAGGTGNDAVTLGCTLTSAMAIDLGGGANKLTLGNGDDAGSVGNVNTLISGSGADAITLATAQVNASADLGTGADVLALANFTNRLSVANTETLVGGSGSDTVVLTGATASLVIGGGGMNFITGNNGADRFVLDQNGTGNATTVTNFNSAKGDRIALDTTANATLSGNAYDLGGAALIVGTDLANVANAAGRLGTTLSNAGNGAFVYQRDTGGLYYSGNGSFSGGGTLIGTILTNGSTPWAFNANSFAQV